jgi:hypothetical protein
LVLKELAEIETAIHQLRKQINALEGDEEEWVEEGFQNDENQQWWNSDYRV